MISVIIPLMRHPEYEEALECCLNSLGCQTAEHEVIISEHPIEPKIRKNYLLNRGFEKAKGDIIFHCDADLYFSNPNLLEGMEDALTDVIFPVFRSSINHKLKMADGAPFARRSVFEKHGPLDESLLGISYVTFPFFLWCLENVDTRAYPHFEVTHGFATHRGKRHIETKRKLQPVFEEVQAHDKYVYFD